MRCLLVFLTLTTTKNTTRPPEVLYGVHQELKLLVSVFLKTLHGFAIVETSVSSQYV